MKICLLNTCFDAILQSPSELHHQYRHPRSLAQALMNRGHKVTLIQGFHQNHETTENNLEICHIKLPAFAHGVPSLARRAIAYLPAMAARRRITRFLSSRDMDALHVFGTCLWPEMAAIASALHHHPVAFSFSYHGGAPARNSFIRNIQAKSLSRATSLFFPAKDAADLWRKTGIFSPETDIQIVPEVSSEFQRRSRSLSQKISGMSGAPLFLWVGRLQETKDPMTALRAFRKIHAAWPSSRLYFIYQNDDLLPDLKIWLKKNETLAHAVSFLGYIPYHDMEIMYNSADFFLQTSRSEIGSNATVEAMACGAVPVTSNLPSLTFLLGGGKAGYLFPMGDAEACANVILGSGESRLKTRSLAIRSYFEAHLSYGAIARAYERAFDNALRNTSRHGLHVMTSGGDA